MTCIAHIIIGQLAVRGIASFLLIDVQGIRLLVIRGPKMETG